MTTSAKDPAAEAGNGNLPLFERASLKRRFELSTGGTIRRFRIRYGGCEKSCSGGKEEGFEQRQLHRAPLNETNASCLSVAELLDNDDSFEDEDGELEITCCRDAEGTLVCACIERTFSNS